MMETNFSLRKPTWKGLGVNVTEARSSREALTMSGFSQMLEDFNNVFSIDPETGKQKLIYYLTDGQDAYRKVCEIGSRNYSSNEDCIRAIMKETSAEEFFLAIPFLRRG